MPPSSAVGSVMKQDGSFLTSPYGLHFHVFFVDMEIIEGDVKSRVKGK